MSWWELGEWSGKQGNELALYEVTCAFCGVKGNFETVAHLERKKPGVSTKKLNYDTLKCGECGNFMFVFWSGGRGLHSFRVLPWYNETTAHPEHWPTDIGKFWLEARRSLEGKNWTAASVMARSGIQLIARSHNANGKNLKEEIDDLADKGVLLPIMKEWAHEVRDVGNEGAHPKPGSTGTDAKDARDVVEFFSQLMTVLYDLPKQIADYRARKT